MTLHLSNEGQKCNADFVKRKVLVGGGGGMEKLK
jgi:hypothetical protein